MRRQIASAMLRSETSEDYVTRSLESEKEMNYVKENGGKVEIFCGRDFSTLQMM